MTSQIARILKDADPHHPRLSQARHPVPRHHHPAGRRRGLPPGGGRAGAALRRRARSTRWRASRRGASSSAARWPTSFRPASCPLRKKGKLPHETVAHRLRAGIRRRRDGDARGRGEAGREGAAGRRPDRHRRHGRGGGEAAARRSAPMWSPPCFVIDLPDLGGAEKIRGAGRAGAHADVVRRALTVPGARASCPFLETRRLGRGKNGQDARAPGNPLQIRALPVMRPRPRDQTPLEAMREQPNRPPQAAFLFDPVKEDTKCP